MYGWDGSQTNLLLQIFIYDACALHTRGATDIIIVCDYSRDFIEKESNKDIVDEEERAVPNLGNGSKCMYCVVLAPSNLCILSGQSTPVPD